MPRKLTVWLLTALLLNSMLITLWPGQKALASDADYYTGLQSELQALGLPEGQFMFGSNYTDVITNMSLDVGDPSWATKEIVDVDPADGLPFDKAIKITTSGKRTNPYDVDLTFRTTAPVAKDDIFLTVVYFKKLYSASEAGTAESLFALKNFDHGWVNWTYTPGNMSNGGDEWQKYYFASAAPNDAGGTATVDQWFSELQFGFQKQTVLIGGYATIKYPSTVDKSKLPTSNISFTYDGHAADAPWRAEAAARIDQIRKGNLEVTVTDSEGQPVADAQVQVKMKKHAYGFGSAVPALNLNNSSLADKIFQQKFYQLFNRATFENDLTWSPWIGGWDDNFGKQQVLNALPKLESRGMPVKGHVLFWDGLAYHNDPAKNLNNIYAAKVESEGQAAADAWMKQTILEHIDDIAGTLQGRIAEWNVKNEPYNFRIDVEKFGDVFMAEMFNRAHAADPNAKLFVNEAGWLQGADNGLRDHLYDLIDQVMADGGVIHGAGEEGHYGASSLPSIPRLIANMDAFKTKYPNLDLQITEFDINAYRNIDAQVQVQADFTRDYLTAMFSHPATSAVTSWGFWAGRHWYPDAAYYNNDWTIRPNGQAYLDTVFGDFWTDVSGTTDAQGKYTTDGFLGEYDIVVTSGDINKKITHVLGHNKASGQLNRVTVQLPAEAAPLPGFTVDDPMADFSEMYLHSSNVAIATADAADYGGDADRLVKNSAAAASAMYRVKNMKSFNAAVYYAKQGDSDAVSNYVRLSLSPDGKVWAPAETLVSETAAGNGIFKADLKQPGYIPAGINYIRVEFTEGTAAGAAQVASLSMASDEADNIFEVVKVEAIHDYFDDMSQVFAMSGGIKTDAESLFTGTGHTKAIQLDWGKTGPEHIVYDVSKLYVFDKFEVYRLHNEHGANGTIRYYVSPNNTDWTEVTAEEQLVNDTPGYDGVQYGYNLYKDTNTAAIPKGTHYFKVEFTGGAEWAYRFAQVHLTGTRVESIEDYFDDWSKAYSHTSGIKADAESLFDNGHPNAIQLDWGKSGPESVVYDTSKLRKFGAFEVYRLHNAGGANGTIKYYTSADGISWTEVQADSTQANDMPGYIGGQYAYDLYIDRNKTPIPAGANYFKLEFTGGAEWAYRFTRVFLSSGEVDAISDYFDDWSKAYSHTDGIKADAESLFVNGHPNAIQLNWGNTTQAESVVYDTSNLKQFGTFEVFRLHNPYGDNGTIKYYGSADGILWNELAAETLTANYFPTYDGRKYDYNLYVDRNAGEIPAGTRYFKVEFQGGAEWAYRIAQVHLGNAYTPQELQAVVTDNSAYTLAAGATEQLQITAHYNIGSSDVTGTAVYSSGNPSVATVSAGGLFTAVAPGTATITAAYGGKTAAVEVTVTAQAPVLQSISADAASYTLTVGATRQTVVQAVYDIGDPVTVTGEAAYVSSDTGVATVSAGGLVTAVAPGTATITAAYGGKTATVAVTVTAQPPVLQSISVDAASYNLTIGSTRQTVVKAIYDSGDPVVVTGEAVYESGNPGVATVSASGLVTAKRPGTAAITVTYGGKTATVSVTVTPPSGNPTPSNPGNGGANPNPGQQVVNEESLKNAKDGKVSIDIAGGKKEVLIPAKAAAGMKDSRLELKAQGLSLLVAPETLQALTAQVSQEALIQAKVVVRVDAATEAPDAGDAPGSVKLKAAGVVYDFGLALVTGDGRELMLEAFPEPTVVSFDYNASDIDEDKLGVYYFNETAQSWEYVGGKVDKKANKISAGLKHFSTYAVMEMEKSFADVADTSWYAHAVKVLAAKHIAQGRTESAFAPEGTATRAEFAAMLVQLLDLKPKGAASFVDVDADAWYAEAVSAAVAAGIVSGRSAGAFAPEDAITRQEMATMLVRAYTVAQGKIAIPATASGFADAAEIAGWAQADVQAAVAAGLMTGMGNGTFAPKVNTNRAQTAQAVYNLMTKLQA